MTQQPTQSHDSRSLVAIFLCIVFYLGYQKYISWKYPDLQKPTVPQSSPESVRSSEATATAPGNQTLEKSQVSGEQVAAIPEDQLLFETDTSVWRFSQKIGGIQSVELKNYRRDKDIASQPVNLLDSTMKIHALTSQEKTTPSEEAFHAERTGRSLKLWRQSGPFRITQEFTIPEKGYTASLKVTYLNTQETSHSLYGSLRVEETLKPQKASSILGFIPGVVTHQDQIVSYVDSTGQWSPLVDFCKAGSEPQRGSKSALKYIGIDRHYFLALLIPKSSSTDFTAEQLKSIGPDCGIGLTLGSDLGMIAGGQSFAMEYDIYMGPKDISTLSAASPYLSSAMHLGFFDFIARPLMLVIDSFYTFFKNYGLSIIFLTILLKVIFYPLVKASQVSMYQMKKLNPQMAAIREKWKDDKARQQQELLKFMSQHKINPMKGCLPILPQIPVFFAFYQVLQTSIHLRHAPFFGWIQDLSAMDPYLVTPILMGFAMFVQQKMTPTTGMDKTQEKILLFMPVMFTAMMLTLPAGLTLYMLTNTVVGIGQQQWLMRRLESNQAK